MSSNVTQEDRIKNALDKIKGTRPRINDGFNYWKRQELREKGKLEPFKPIIRAPEEIRKLHQIYTRHWHDKVKQQVMNHYGGKCICCGESKIHFLTLSHPNDDGGKHREEFGSLSVRGGINFYVKLRASNYQSKYELIVECYNCNLARKCNYGLCPHKGIRDKN